jgi:glycosyltransferase involved in cell wall biosynthesis
MSSISIITTVLNDEKNIASCINSVKSQNIKKLEHIIVDGGSSDKTLLIIKKFQQKYNHIKIYRKNKINIYEGLNFAIKKAKNNYIGVLHSDDFYKNANCLKLVVKEFKKNNSISALYSNVSIVKRSDKNKQIRFFKSKQYSSKDFLNGYHPPHTSLFVKKHIFRRFGNYNETLKIASDYEFMLRVFGINKVKIKFVNKTLIVMKSGGTSTKNILNIALSNFEVYKAFRINKLNYTLNIFINKLIKKIFQIRI